MIRRFRLEQKSSYEKLVIARRLSEMLDNFLSGRDYPLCIGAEQGGIQAWDDVVIHHSDTLWEHLQIKRQSTPFSNKHIDKAEYLESRRPKSKKTGKGAVNQSEADATQPAETESEKAVPADKDIESELDKAFKSLAAWSRSDDAKKLPARMFSLTLPGIGIDIKGKGKDALRVNHLHEFCDLCQKDGADLDAISKRDDKPTQNVYTWLTTWCGFQDWKHVVDTMRMLKVICIGDDHYLEVNSEESLRRHFIQPDVTLSLLLAYISDSTTDTNVVTCYSTAKHLRGMLLPDCETWTQYLVHPAPSQGWTVAGTHDLCSTPTVPPAHAALDVVNHHWNAAAQNRKLRLHSKYAAPAPSTAALPSAILRLALHLKSGSHCLLLDEAVWRQGAANELGDTLGVGDRDLEDLPWLDNVEPLSCAVGRNLSTITDSRRESAALHEAMNDLVWQQLQACVAKKLTQIRDGDLLSTMELMWLEWSAELTADPNGRHLLFEQMMYPETEGIDAKQALRIGPRTVELLETATLMLLLVSVGLGKGGACWRSIPEIGDVLSIALRSWSGEAADNSGVRSISEEENLMSLLGRSPAPLVILAGVESSSTYVIQPGLADDLDLGNSMAAERQPRMLITRNEVYKQLRVGTLASLQNGLQHKWKAWVTAREAAIEASGKGH
ncbi:ABC-three component system protein [Pseudomonas viridiflava]|uniref:ABC-three component system protein n=1 Tax=Pseudomonas viridiflava TaxID=33069 RepID=UPI000F015D12|nr:ABC-three component system protein [Pseudomonas viridiflava]